MKVRSRYRTDGERLFSFKLKGGNTKPESMRFEGVLADLERTRRRRAVMVAARLMAYQTSSVWGTRDGV